MSDSLLLPAPAVPRPAFPAGGPARVPQGFPVIVGTGGSVLVDLYLSPYYSQDLQAQDLLMAARRSSEGLSLRVFLVDDSSSFSSGAVAGCLSRRGAPLAMILEHGVVGYRRLAPAVLRSCWPSGEAVDSQAVLANVARMQAIGVPSFPVIRVYRASDTTKAVASAFGKSAFSRSSSWAAIVRSLSGRVAGTGSDSLSSPEPGESVPPDSSGRPVTAGAGKAVR